MQDFKRLKVWERAHQLTLEVYSISKKFPRDELFALTNQIRRASFSVAANIAEGSGRISKKEFAYFLDDRIRICKRGRIFFDFGARLELSELF